MWIIGGRELHHSSSKYEGYELDGNTLIISAICNTWRVNGKDKQLGQEFCDGLKPVINWVDTSMVKSPYWGADAILFRIIRKPRKPFFVGIQYFCQLWYVRRAGASGRYGKILRRI